MILQNLEHLERELHAGVFRPAYFVLGPEEYLCREAVKLIRTYLVSPESAAFDFAEFIAGEAAVEEIVESANTFPMISKRRLVLVQQIERFKDQEQDAILNALKTLHARSTIALSASDLDRRKKFYRVLKDTCCTAEFPVLKGPALERWAEAYIKKHGHRMAAPALKKLLDLAGSDLQSLVGEIEKLFLFSGATQNIPDSAVDDLVRGSRQQSVFELVDAVARRDRGGALKSLANLLATGEHPLYVVTMLARHCRQVIIAQELLQQRVPAPEIRSTAQIPHFMLNQFLKDARTIDPASVREMLVRLADIDRRLKSTAADGRMLIENLICAIV